MRLWCPFYGGRSKGKEPPGQGEANVAVSGAGVPEGSGLGVGAPGRAGAALVRPWLLGLVSSVLLSAGASLPGSPLVLDRPGAWFFGSARGAPTEASLILSVLGLVGLSLGWLDLLRALRSSPGIEPGRLAPLAASCVLPLLVAPPMLTHDVYLYAAQGRLLLAGHNPNLVAVGALPHDPFRRLVDPIWLTAPSLYGPLFSVLEAGAVLVSGYHVLWTVVVLRAVAVLGFATMVAVLPRIARVYGVDPATAVALGPLSPLVLLYVVAPGRNDALMLALVVVAVALATEGYPFAGIVVAAVGAAVKLPALGAAGFVTWEWASADPGLGRRLLRLGAGLGATSGVLEVGSLVTGLGWSWLGGLGAPARIWNFFTPDDAVTTLVLHLGAALGVRMPLGSLLGIIQLVVGAAAIIGCAGLLLSVHRLRLVPALGVALLVVALAAPALHAWYLAWGTVLLAAGTGRARQGLLVWTVLVATLAFLPGPRTLAADLLEAGAIAVATLVLHGTAVRRSRQLAVGGSPG